MDPAVDIPTDMSTCLRENLQFAVKVTEPGLVYRCDAITEEEDDLEINDDYVPTGVADMSRDIHSVAEEHVEHDPNFRWLDPELPSERVFRARMTHIDCSGTFVI